MALWASFHILILTHSFSHSRIRQPILPDFVDRMWVRQLRVGHSKVDMYFEHEPGGGTKMDVLKVDGKLDIIQC